MHHLEYNLLSCLALARREMNTRRPVNTLSPDILAYIFELTRIPMASPSFAKNELDEKAESRLGPVLLSVEPYYSDVAHAVVLSHVCHYWRGIAIHTTALWKTINCNDRRHIVRDFQLERARPSNILTLYVTGIPAEWSRKCFGLPESSRIRTLIWDQPPIHDATSTVLDFSVPELESLYLYDTTPSTSRSVATAFRAIFSGDAPKLKRAVFFQLRSLPANQFDCLTHLSLCKVDSPFPALYTVLSRCPALEDLVLSQVPQFPPREDDGLPWPALRSIRLSSLSHIILDDVDPSAIRALLSRIDVPDSLAMYVDNKNSYGHWESQRLLFNSSGYFYMPLARSATSALLNCTDEHSVTVVVVGPAAGLSITLYPDTVEYRRCTEVLQAVFCEADVTELYILGESPLPKRLWRAIEDFLEAFPSAQLLVVQDCYASKTMDVIAARRSFAGPFMDRLATMWIVCGEYLSCHSVEVVSGIQSHKAVLGTTLEELVWMYSLRCYNDMPRDGGKGDEDFEGPIASDAPTPFKMRRGYTEQHPWITVPDVCKDHPISDTRRFDRNPNLRSSLWWSGSANDYA